MNIVAADSTPQVTMIAASQDHVADREDPGPDPEDGVAEGEVVLELQLSERDVHAVEVRDHVDQEEERDEPARGLAKRALLQSHAPTLTRLNRRGS
jgi:hypothetical protein